MKKIIIIALLCLSTLIFALNKDNYIPNDGMLTIEERTEGSFDITVRTTTHNGQYAPIHCFALWITTDQDTFVKTVERKALSYMQHLVKFMQMTGGNSVGAVTGASLNTHITHNVSWNGQNYSGADMPDGIYRLYIELTESNSANGSIPDGPWTMIEFEKSATGYSNTYANQTNYHDLAIDYTPVIPVSLMNLSGDTVGEFISISWQAIESGVAGYDVYRNDSDDYNTATAITSTFIPGQNLDIPSNYSYDDLNVVEDNTYYYWVVALSMDAVSYEFGPVEVTYLPVSIDENNATPILSDAGNFPNPFNPETTIKFSLETQAKTEINVYNTRGQLVRTLGNKLFSAGSNEVVFNAEDLASGVYHYSIKSGSSLIWRSMVLVK